MSKPYPNIRRTTDQLTMSKRTRLPYIISDECPKCHRRIDRDVSKDPYYLAYPVAGRACAFYFYCEECDAEWEVTIRFDVLVTLSGDYGLEEEDEVQELKRRYLDLDAKYSRAMEHVSRFISCWAADAFLQGPGVPLDEIEKRLGKEDAYLTKLKDGVEEADLDWVFGLAKNMTGEMMGEEMREACVRIETIRAQLRGKGGC